MLRLLRFLSLLLPKMSSWQLGVGHGHWLSFSFLLVFQVMFPLGTFQSPQELVLVSLCSLVFETNNVYLLGSIIWQPHHSLLVRSSYTAITTVLMTHLQRLSPTASLGVISSQWHLGGKLAHVPVTFQNLLQVPALPILVPKETRG